MENSLDTLKEEHILNLEQLILILESYKKYIKTNIKQWDNSKYKELDNINTQMDDLMEGFFSIV